MWTLAGPAGCRRQRCHRFGQPPRATDRDAVIGPVGSCFQDTDLQSRSAWRCMRPLAGNEQAGGSVMRERQHASASLDQIQTIAWSARARSKRARETLAGPSGRPMLSRVAHSRSVSRNPRKVEIARAMQGRRTTTGHHAEESATAQRTKGRRTSGLTSATPTVPA